MAYVSCGQWLLLLLCVYVCSFPGDDWTMMRSISVTEYLNYEGGKFSKSRNTGGCGWQALQEQRHRWMLLALQKVVHVVWWP